MLRLPAWAVANEIAALRLEQCLSHREVILRLEELHQRSLPPLQVHPLSGLPEYQVYDPLTESTERLRRGDIVVDFLHVIAIV